ncbi:CPBP family intramembrane glutamic endopeptidase [Methanobrevibacter thaueri]|uniref:CAAX amino terminal protease self-immunity n=1 Tax=Methanobrevibacter thaueri TaxID=190975 RepID=A0A315XMF0_9EURY|nr:CPBP family intramembrane glutamic endopeptidase [Methanobrevibacter thaueri]PWB87551.1 CAAX amino terminal protease self- immunity [Methanobrevibacter thaueri]
MDIHKKFFSKIGFNYLILGIITLIFQIIILNIINLTNPQYLTDINIISIVSTICNYILPFPIFYWLMKKISSTKLEKTGIGIKTFILYLGITITLMWIGNLIGLAITSLLSSTMQSDITNPVQELINSADIWFNLIIISLLAPIFEEILFRKLLIDRTIKYGAKVSIILSAVIFALFHGNLNQFFYALLMGGFFAYVYIKTGRIIYTIILHSIINLMGSVVSLFVANSVNNLMSVFNSLDFAILITYIMILLLFLIIGIYGLTKLEKARFNGQKTEIALKNPFRTMFLNYGMICLTAFYIIMMIRQTLG